MNIQVIGCGNAFSANSFNQSFLIEEGGRKMLIDCGYQVPNALQFQGIDINGIDDIYISHLHADHIGGLEFFAFNRYDWSKKTRVAEVGKAPNIIANVKLLEDLWNKSLKGGLESMEGFVAKNMDMYGNSIDWDKEFKKEGFAGKLAVGQKFKV